MQAAAVAVAAAAAAAVRQWVTMTSSTSPAAYVDTHFVAACIQLGTWQSMAW